MSSAPSRVPVPSPSANTSDAEDSINYEFGYRYGRSSFRAETTVFYTDYENLLGECTVASGCSTGDVGDQFDGGEVESYGFEGLLAVLGDLYLATCPLQESLHEHLVRRIVLGHEHPYAFEAGERIFDEPRDGSVFLGGEPNFESAAL